MVILVLNCGSSSIKYQVLDVNDAEQKLLAKGLVERIGLTEGDLTHKPQGKDKFELHCLPPLIKVHRHIDILYLQFTLLSIQN